MKITLAKSAGFCFGVKRALKIAVELAQSGMKVEMLGDIVHNERVVKEIEKSGIKKISRLKKGAGKTLLIRAHGAGIKTLDQAKNFGYKIMDATCPMVKEIHKIAVNMEKQGYKIAIIGDSDHDEVRGIAGQLSKKAVIIEPAGSIPYKKLKKNDKVCVVVQSTQDIGKITEIVKKIDPAVKEMRFFNTICNPTRIKQKEIRSLPLKNDCMVIIGSKNSANTKRLYEISRSLNRKSYWVESKEGLRPEWFKGVKSVGVSAGASTPDWTTKEVIKAIKRYSG